MRRSRLSILTDDDSDPMVSSVHLVDVFLVAMAMLMVSLMNSPLAGVVRGDFTLIRDAGEPTMEIIVREGEEVTRFESTGGSNEGNGIEAGTAYRMQDGSVVYVPKANDKSK